MSVDTARVLELYVPTIPGVGSGYRVGVDMALTAAHVVDGLPRWGPGEPVPEDVDAPGVCRARPLGESGWVPAVVAWRDEDNDLAVLRLAATVSALSAGSPAPRWGRVDGTEPVAVTAVGFPWAQECPDRVRDSEQLFGFVAPATTVKSGQCAVTVLTAAPAERAGSSPWAGMSGAALFTGPFLVGIVVVDPARFGADRVVAVPVAPLLGGAEMAGLLGAGADAVVRVGPRFRLAVTAETSVAVTPPYRAPTGRLGREPARLLLPEYGIVPFVGRDGDLEMLEGWCLSDAASALRVVVGAGGSGKTRLAAEACVRMGGQGWQPGFADPKTPGGQALLEFDQPTLLVVDDADLHVALLADLVRTVAYWPPGAPPVRLLLLARHTTGWWETLNQRTGRLAAELADSPVMLHDGGLAPAERSDHHARALRAFATYVLDPATPGGQAPPVLADPVFANPLLVHMHALLSVCGAQVPTTGTAVRERILDAVLGRERERWAETFPTSFPTGGDRTRQQVVTAATLLAPPTETATAQTMTIIGELQPDAAAGARAAVASWLRELYPGGDPPWVAPLRPDLLAEQLLASCPQLTELSLAGYSSITVLGQREQLLTELIRAGSRAPVREALDQLLVTQLPGLLTTATGNPFTRLPDLLAVALTRCPQPEASATLVSQLPEHSVGLAALAATFTSQAVDHHRQLAAARPDEFTPNLAGMVSNLSLRLSDLGRREDALATADEAVALYRQLAAARPDAFTPNLAMAVNNLSLRLSDLGRREDALATADEAVALYRQLAAARPDAFTLNLAIAVNNLGKALSELGRREDALAAADEAVALTRQLAAARPDAFTPNLAMAVTNLAKMLSELGRREDALAGAEEAVALYRQLAAARPDAFTPDLARAVGNLSVFLSELGRREDALAAAEEAVALYRQLAAARPDAFTPGLAMAVTNLAKMLSELGRREDALAAAEEAVALYRQLAAARPDTFTPDLARAVGNLSLFLSELGRREDALAAAEEAVALNRQLAAARPDTFTPDLARAVGNLSLFLSELGRREDALAAAEEAVALNRQLAAARPDAFTPGLAAAVTNLAKMLSELGRREDALAAAEEAVALYRQLAAARPDKFTPDLARAVGNLSLFLSELGRREDALAADEEAVALNRQLAAARPDAFTPGLATAVSNLAASLSELGRGEDALAADEEAVSLYRQLAAARPDAFTPDLARAVNNLSAFLSELGRGEDALAAAEEAVALYRQLAAARPDAFTPDLAGAASNLSAFLSELGRGEDALAAAEEAVALYRQLAAARPDAFTPGLATAVSNLAASLSELGRGEDALAADEEAVALYRQLAAARPDAFTPDLAETLIAYGVHLTEQGRHRDALAADREAVELYRSLQATHPNVFHDDELEALKNLVIDLRSLNLNDEAEQIERDLRTLTDKPL